MAKTTPFFHPYALLPVLVIATTLILSFLCVFAGNTPGMMDSYSIFTLNTTRLGQNAVQKIDDKIMSFNATRIIAKRDMPAQAIVYGSMITPAPGLAVRQDLDDMFSELTAGAASIKSNAASIKSNAGDAIDSVQTAVATKISSAASAVESKASSIEGVVASKLSSAIHSAQTAVSEAVNGTYNDWIDELDLKGFYSIHLRTTCSGFYKTPSGANITIGDSPSPPNGTHRVVDTCSSHSALNPLGLIRIIFYIGIFFTALCLCTSVWTTIRYSTKKAWLVIILSLAALAFLGLASILTHGLAVATSKILNLLGSEIGLRTTYGGKWIALAWATVILLLVNIGLWVLICLFGDNLPGPARTLKISGKAHDNEKVDHYGTPRFSES